MKPSRAQIEACYNSLATARQVGGLCPVDHDHLRMGMVPDDFVLRQLAHSMVPHFMACAERREAVQIVDRQSDHNPTEHVFRADVVVMHPQVYSDISNLLRRLLEESVQTGMRTTP